MDIQDRIGAISNSRWLFPTVAIVALYSIAPSLFQDPRFWAEEGSVYYEKAIVSDWSFLFTFVSQGNYQFLINLFVYLATFAGNPMAPFVTTYLAVAVFSLVAMQLGTVAKQYRIPPEISILSLLALCLSPPTTEIFATATNVQWVAALSVLLVTITSYSNSRPSKLIVTYVWVGACGLTGVPSILLAPFFFIQAYLSKSRPHLIMGIILVTCIAVQAIVMLNHSHPGRDLTFSPVLILSPFILQTLFAQLIGVNLTNILGSMVVLNSIYLIFILIVGVSFVFICLSFVKDKEDTKHAAIILSLAWIFVSVLQTEGAIRPVQDEVSMVAGAYGGRYFATGSLCTLVLLSLAGISRARPFVALAFVVVVMNGALYSFDIRKQMAANYPSWSKQVENCQYPCTIKIWPDTWTVTLRR